MQVRREPAHESTLENFADEHGLALVITERQMDAWQRANRIPRYIARFDNVEVGGDGLLQRAYGDGETEDAAITAYADAISNETIVIDAMKESRRVVRVPRLKVHP